jgi:alpha-glucosidase
MLGPSILVAPVVTPGATRRAVRTPAGADWIDPWTGALYAGGRMAMLDARLGRPPILARVGSLIPVNRAPARFNETRVDPGFMLFPLQSGEMSIALHADDGESPIDVAAARPGARVEVRCGASSLEITAEGLTGISEIGFIVPPGETRRLAFPGPGGTIKPS